MTHYDKDGEIDFYRMWVDAVRRIQELEALVETVKGEALKRLEKSS